MLNLLSLQEGHFGRFRDIFIDKDRNIVVYTRIGGPNKESYQYIYDELKNHPLYINSRDDSFDSTYALFFFNGESFKELLKDIPSKEYPEESWKNFLNKF